MCLRTFRNGRNVFLFIDNCDWCVQPLSSNATTDDSQLKIATMPSVPVTTESLPLKVDPQTYSFTNKWRRRAFPNAIAKSIEHNEPQVLWEIVLQWNSLHTFDFCQVTEKKCFTSKNITDIKPTE